MKSFPPEPRESRREFTALVVDNIIGDLRTATAGTDTLFGQAAGAIK